MDWLALMAKVTDITQPAAHVVQVLAVIIGGAWAYIKFLRGRTFRPRAQLNLDTSVCLQDGQPFILARVSLENHGLSYVRLQEGLRVLFVDEARSTAIPGVPMAWETKPSFFVTPGDLFGEDEGLEPGETLREDVLVPLGGPSTPVAYRVRVFVRTQPPRSGKEPVRWTTNRIVLPKP